MNINHIDLRHLRYFIAVAEELHFGRAAKRLNISQPPLSQQIMALENHLGVLLFRRHNRHVELTPAGHFLLPEAKRLAREVGQIAIQTKNAENGMSGHLRIGVNFSAPLHPFTAVLLREYRKRYPAVQLELVLHERPNILQLVDIVSSDLDLALIWLDQDHQKASIQRLDLAWDPLDAVVPLDHPLAKCTTMDLRKMAEYPFIAPPRDSGTQLYEGARAAFWSVQRKSEVLYEALQMPLILSMVAAGQGLALLPRFLSHLPNPGVAFVPLAKKKGEAFGMTFNLVAHRTIRKAHAQNFYDLAAQISKTYNKNVASKSRQRHNATAP